MPQTYGNTNWVTPTVSDLNDYLAGPYATAVQNAALAAGQANPFADIMTNVVLKIRTAIRGGSVKNVNAIQVSLTPNTIPPDMLDDAMALIVERMQGRLRNAGIKLGAEAIEKAADVARRNIERVQAGIATVTMPTDPLVPDDQERGGATQIVRANRRLFNRRTLRGL